MTEQVKPKTKYYPSILKKKKFIKNKSRIFPNENYSDSNSNSESETYFGHQLSQKVNQFIELSQEESFKSQNDLKKIKEQFTFLPASEVIKLKGHKLLQTSSDNSFPCPVQDFTLENILPSISQQKTQDCSKLKFYSSAFDYFIKAEEEESCSDFEFDDDKLNKSIASVEEEISILSLNKLRSGGFNDLATKIKLKLGSSTSIRSSLTKRYIV